MLDKIKQAYKYLKKAGDEFATTSFAGLARKLMSKDLNEDDKSTFSGVAGVGAGGALKTIGYIGLGLTALALVANPLSISILSLVGTAALATAFGSAVAFGKGMEDGGDRLSGVVTMRKNMMKGFATVIREDFKQWREAKLKGPFQQASAKEQPAPAEAPKPAPAPAPQDTLKM